MSDYDHTQHNRSYPQSSFETGTKGTGLFWLLFAVAGLGILVLIGSLGGGSLSVDHPGGAGADPVITPAAPETGTGTVGTVGTSTIVE